MHCQIVGHILYKCIGRCFLSVKVNRVLAGRQRREHQINARIHTRIGRQPTPRRHSEHVVHRHDETEHRRLFTVGEQTATGTPSISQASAVALPTKLASQPRALPTARLAERMSGSHSLGILTGRSARRLHRRGSGKTPDRAGRGPPKRPSREGFDAVGIEPRRDEKRLRAR